MSARIMKEMLLFIPSGLCNNNTFNTSAVVNTQTSAVYLKPVRVPYPSTRLSDCVIIVAGRVHPVSLNTTQHVLFSIPLLVFLFRDETPGYG